MPKIGNWLSKGQKNVKKINKRSKNSAELNKSEQTIELSYYDNDDCVEDIVDLHSLGSVENETDDSFNDELKPEENKGFYTNNNS